MKNAKIICLVLCMMFLANIPVISDDSEKPHFAVDSRSININIDPPVT